VQDDTYNKLIKEIASKYYNTTNPSATQIISAQDLFKNSGIYQTILESIEDVKDSDNDSQVTSFSGGKKWYDEVVRTFAIREFTTSAITLPNITTSFKIDITAGPSQSAFTRDENFANGYYGKWYLTVFLRETPDTFINSNVFNPNLGAGNLISANNAGTVLANRVYINGADFIIPAATTADMEK